MTLHRIHWLTEAPTDGTHFGGKVAFPDCSETKPDCRTTRWSRVIDLEVSAGNAKEVMRCARRRRAIGNGAFRSLTGSTGYSFEHNPGHGEEHLSGRFAHLSMIAFPVDRIREHCRPMFRQALAKLERWLWQKLTT